MTLFASLALALPAAGQTVSLNGNLGPRQALLVIDGQLRAVQVGGTVLGVRLLSLSGAQAEVEVGGQRRRLLAGANPVRLSDTASGISDGQEIVMAAGEGGHFTADGQINGKAVTFLVDTGASVVSIGQADADRLGLDYKTAPGGFANTANGRIPVRSVTLASVRVGDVTVANVAAVVMPLSMPQVLLGNSFLTRFQMTRDNDTLRLSKRPN